MLQLDVHCEGDNNFELQVTLELPARGITVIYGPSGCGKSTLLDCIAGLRTPGTGSTLRIGDALWRSDTVNEPPWSREVGYVFQDARLFEHLSVRGNLDYAEDRRCERNGVSRDKICQMLQLTPLLDKQPQTLSAGQQQRVAIARALLRAPALLLMDEPLANLDHVSKQNIMAALSSIAKDTDVPVLYVSHDIEEVSQLADYLVLLENGRVSAHGPAIDLASRLDTRLSEDAQAAAILTGSVSEHEEDYALTHIRVGEQCLQVNRVDQPAGTLCRIRVPARDVSLCRARPDDTSILNILRVTVDDIENTTAPRLLVRLALEDQFLLARITRKSLHQLDLKIGDNLFAQIKSVALLMGAN